MRIELEPKDKFMHKPGELFIASDRKLHVLAQVTNDKDPTGLKSEKYTAVCSYKSQSWSMPSQDIRGAEFVASLEDGKKKGANKCSKCFESKKEDRRIGISYVIVEKADILKKSVPVFLLDYINLISLPQIKSGDGNYSKMVLTINGYDNDARPLWDIPEVVEWYRELHTKHPYMPLFLTPGSVQVYFQVLRPIAYSIIPAEYRDKKDLVGLLLHTLSERNKYFSGVLGSDYDRCQSILNAADKSVADAVTNLVKGIEEPL